MGSPGMSVPQEVRLAKRHLHYGFILACGTLLVVKNIDLTGQLICHGDEEIAVVMEFLPQHVELTHAEPGCISFEVNQTDDPRVWDVAERFRDADAFHSHQARVKASAWGRATAGIKRSYSVTGL